MDLSGLPESERIRKQKITASNNHAYTLEEIATVMEKLPAHARTICTLSAFTGLSRSELWGLKWEDYKDGQIKVQRKIVNGVVGAPKTEARESASDVTPMIQKVLLAYKKEFPPVGEGWVFRGEKGGPLNLDNVSRRDIPQYIDGA
jgi:integrase